MNLKKLAVASLGVMMLAGMAAWAEGNGGQGAEGVKVHNKGKGEAKPAVAATDIKVEGVVAKNEKTNKDGKVNTRYELTDATGVKINLPAARAGKGGAAAAYNLDDFVGFKVTVVGKGVEKEGRGGKRSIQVTKIESIVKADTGTPAVPAAAPAAEPAKAVEKAL